MAYKTTRYQRERGNYQQKLRRIVLERDKAKCIHCRSKTRPEVAHIFPVSMLRRNVDAIAAHHPALAVVMCHTCHMIFDGRYKIAPAYQAEMTRLQQRRLDILSIKKNDIELLNQDELEEYKGLGFEMQSLFKKTEFYRDDIVTSICLYLRCLYAIPKGRDPVEAAYSIVLKDFIERNQFWCIPAVNKHKARKIGLSWSRGLKNWYAPAELDVEKEANEIGELTMFDIEECVP